MSDYFIVGRRFLGCFQVLGNRLVFVHSHTLGVGADVSFVEDASGKQIKLLFFQSQQQAASNLGCRDNLLQRNTPHLSLLTQTFAK